MRTREQRKLDSLARLLERSFVCAAVCNFDGKLFVSTNKYTSGSQTATKNKLLSIVESVKKGYFEQSDFALFENIVLDSVKASTQGKLTFNENEIKAIAREILSKDGLEAWGETTTKELKTKYKTRSRTSDAFLIGSIAERLAIDFFKVKKEFLDDDKENLLHKDLEVELLPASQQDVHAEMTILGKIIELTEPNGPTTPIYIGISKKCCDRCMDVIKAFNQINQPCQRLIVDDSDEELSENELTDEQALNMLPPEEKKKVEQERNESKMILVSGSHAQRQTIAHYDAKKKKWVSGWVKPNFLTNEELEEIMSDVEIESNESDEESVDPTYDLATLKDCLQDEYNADFPEDSKKGAQAGEEFDMDAERSDNSPPPSPKFKPNKAVKVAKEAKVKHVKK